MLNIKRIEGDFTVCKVKDFSQIDWNQPFCFVSKTDEELSVVCQTAYTPSNTIEREDGWSAFRIEGTLEFSLIGILANISGILAEQKIGIFAVSTYNTDYILTKSAHFERAISALENAGYKII